MNGIRSLLIVLSPCDSLWLKSSMIRLWVPVLLLLTLCSTSTALWLTLSLTLKSPSVLVRCTCLRAPVTLPVITLLPVQKSDQDPHIWAPNPVWASNPSLAARFATVDAKSPSLLITRASILTVSTQVSDSGVKSIIPFQYATINGVTDSVLDPNGCLEYSCSE